MIKKGFTLAEVLITLAIMGVVAALTIPGLIANTQGKQYSTAYKKAVATLGQGVNKAIALDGVDMSNLADAKIAGTDKSKYCQVVDGKAPSPKKCLEGFMKQNFNVQKTDGDKIYLADGTMYDISNATIKCTANLPCLIGVDVNGDASPNANYKGGDQGAQKLTDRFLILVTDVAVFPFAKTIVNADTGEQYLLQVNEGGQIVFSYDFDDAAEAANFAMTGKKTTQGVVALPKGNNAGNNNQNSDDLGSNESTGDAAF